jgi:hypothetical protein
MRCGTDLTQMCHPDYCRKELIELQLVYKNGMRIKYEQ